MSANNLLAALQALKRKKRLEQQLTQIDGTLSTIEFQREALENSHTNTEVVRNMGYAAQAMKKVHDSMWGIHRQVHCQTDTKIKLNNAYLHNLVNLEKPKTRLSFLRDLNKIDDLMEDINEQQDVAREINEAISRPYGETYDEVYFLPWFSSQCSYYYFLNIFLNKWENVVLRMSCWPS